MRFERVDGLLVDPIEAGAIELQLQDTLGFYVEVSESGKYFDVDLEKHGIELQVVQSAIDQSVYRLAKSNE